MSKVPGYDNVTHFPLERRIADVRPPPESKADIVILPIHVVRHPPCDTEPPGIDEGGWPMRPS